MTQDWIDLIQAGACSLIVGQDAVPARIFQGRGIDDLYHLVRQEPGVLHRAQLADKIVGKAAASLMVLAQVHEVYAAVISLPAWQMLEAAGIPTTCGVKVPHIINRQGTGLCPLETRCQHCNTPQECLAEIQAFLTK